MELDAPVETSSLSPRDRIVQRLIQHGIPMEQLDGTPPGLVSFLKKNRSFMPEVVSAILPTDEDISKAKNTSKVNFGGGSRGISANDLLVESLLWLQWLMFENCPELSIKTLVEKAAGKRAVCGSVWGRNDLAYRCRTCEHDSSCAICVPCFQNGNHKDHDYCIIYTGGGCCDCGDVTAWKREGFCSLHGRMEQSQPLPEDAADSIGSVLDPLFLHWKDKLFVVRGNSQRISKEHNDACRKVANELCFAIVKMLLDFCHCSDSLLSFISKRIYSSVGLLDELASAELFLDARNVKNLHELLLILLGEPMFKYEFAKVFVKYYIYTVHENVKRNADSDDLYPLISIFSVQFFTVPVLTNQLVREENLLGVLLGCLEELFSSCIGDSGYVQVNKWTGLFETTFRLVENVRFVICHDEVLKYILCEQPYVIRMWLRLLSLVQGMDPQVRVTGIPPEDEVESFRLSFVLGRCFDNVHNSLAEGALTVRETEVTKDQAPCSSAAKDLDYGLFRDAELGKISEETFECFQSKRNNTSGSASPLTSADNGRRYSIPPSLTRLIFECLEVIESWLGQDIAERTTCRTIDASTTTCCDLFNWKKRTLQNRYIRNQERNYTRFLSLANPTIYRHRMQHKSCKEIRINISLENEGPRESHFDVEPFDSNFLDVDSCSGLEKFGILSFAGWPDIAYDVSSQEVSFQISLHRFLSLLIQKAMEACYGGNHKLETSSATRTILSGCDFFGQVLQGFHPYGFSAFVMEHPLRLRVFCAQVHAGMWRKNGERCIYMSEFYCRGKRFGAGIEEDLFLLQFCAALAPPEMFVMRILERFGLLKYLSLDLAECNKYEPVLVQEMLTLIIQIVKERKYSGLSAAENLQRELIFRLAVGDATHSQLVKALPRDLSKNGQLQKVLETVAVYVGPSTTKQGKYSLRNSYWKELDLYHPHWNGRDLQSAEERYLRFCKASPLNVQLPCWTDVFAPLCPIFRIATSKAVLQVVRAVFFYAVFTERSPVSRAPDGVLVTALHLLSLALDICKKQKSICTNSVDTHADHSIRGCAPAKDLFPILELATEPVSAGMDKGPAIEEHQSLLSLLVLLMRKHKHENVGDLRFCNISSLIESLLTKLGQLNSDCMSELKRLAPDIDPQHQLQYSSNTEAEQTNSALDIERKAKARARQAAMLEKMKAEQSKFISSLESMEDFDLDLSRPNGVPNQEESSPVCSLCRETDSKSPLLFFVLLQKSHLSSLIDRGPISWKQASQSVEEHLSVSDEKHADLSTGRMLDAGSPQTESAQGYEQNMLETFLYAAIAHHSDTKSVQLPSSSISEINPPSIEILENDIYQSVHTDVCNVSFDSDALVADHKHLFSIGSESLGCGKNRRTALSDEYSAFLQGATSEHHWLSPSDIPHLADAAKKPSVSYITSNKFCLVDCDGIHISSCGHAVHQECHDRYLSSLKQSHLRLGIRGYIVDPDKGELLCPVCRRFANSILPDVSSKIWKQIMPSGASLASNAIISDSPQSANIRLCLPYALALLRSTSKAVKQCSFLTARAGKVNETLESSLEPLIRTLCAMYFPHTCGSMVLHHRKSSSLMLWDTLRYSLVSAELAARDRESLSFECSNSSIGPLSGLYDEINSSVGFILTLLLRASLRVQTLDHFQLLLRFGAIQLFASSICDGMMGEIDFVHANKEKGLFSSILDLIDDGERFPVIHFWKIAAEPILACDPFSSLMWILFSLPLPFKSSTESFISLVHLFYVVCVIQALITCHGRGSFDTSTFGDSFLEEICKCVRESNISQQYFVSNYLDDSCSLEEMIRKFTYPYLRKCALLWKLLTSSSSFPSAHGYGNTLLRDESSYMNDDLYGANNSRLEELKGISELEKMFQICSMDVVFRNKIVHSLALKWCKHFSRSFRAQKPHYILYSSPAVPFRLMHLPLLYQELLQRYLKQQCSDCKHVLHEPALCLMCGRLCSPSVKPCCRESRCQFHATGCGAGIGVFLLVRKTTILLQRSAREAPWPSPYLDAFGEEDVGLRRGRPLYLNAERYTALTKLVASHGLDQSSEVLRQTTISLHGFE